MPLRTLVQRLREHDWLAVAIELAVVVVGVYIGLQASNWNQDRLDAMRGREFLLRFDGELQAEIGKLQRNLAFRQQVATYADGALGYAEHGTLVEASAWKTLLAYYQASQVWPYRQSDATFQEMRSSGDLGLIGNAKLRAQLSAHFDSGAGSQALEVIGVLPAYREHVRSLTPWAVQRYIWAQCYQVDGIAQALRDCAAPIPDAEAQALIERFRRDEQLTGELRFWRASLGTSEIVLPGIQHEAEELDALIRRELGLAPLPVATP